MTNPRIVFFDPDRNLRREMQNTARIESYSETHDVNEALAVSRRRAAQITLIDLESLPASATATDPELRSAPRDAQVLALPGAFFLRRHEVAKFVDKCLVDQDETQPTHGVRPAARLARAEALTPREKQVLTLLVTGKKSKEIATLLKVSLHTINAHRSNLMKKVGARSLAGLIFYALREGLVDAQGELR